MKAFRLISSFIAYSSITLLVAGCAGRGKPLETPRISIANIRVEKFTGFETVFQIQLRVINSNDVDLRVKGLDAQLEINGQPFAAGVSNTPVKIPSFGTEVVTVRVYSSVINMFKSVYGLHESEELEYRLNGKLRVTGESTFARTVPFEAAGVLTFDDSRKPESR
jgi:LEA14-like dessication related protein